MLTDRHTVDKPTAIILETGLVVIQPTQAFLCVIWDKLAAATGGLAIRAVRTLHTEGKGPQVNGLL
jgi:hypothetical protein